MNTFAPDLIKSIKGQIFDKSVIDPLEVRQQEKPSEGRTEESGSFPGSQIQFDYFILD